MASSEIARRAGERVSPRRAEWRSIARIFFRRKLAVVGLVIILVVVLLAIFAPLLAPYDPYELEYLESGVMNKLAPPSREHLLGTDSIGRDTLGLE